MHFKYISVCALQIYIGLVYTAVLMLYFFRFFVEECLCFLGTTTVGAIGPAFVSKIDEITGKLSLI